MKSKYVMTEAQVEQLARDHTSHVVASQGGGLTYLRVLLVAVQAQLGTPRGRGRPMSAETQLAALERIEAPLYAAVLRGVVTEDIADDLELPRDERRRRMLARNSRSGFARTAKATLVGYVRAGGDLRTVDPETATKDSLRRAGQPQEPTDRVARQIQRNSEGLQRAIERQARVDPAAARELLEAILEDLQALLDGLGDEGEPAETTARARPPDRGPARTRVGRVLLNRPAMAGVAPHTGGGP